MQYSTKFKIKRFTKELVDNIVGLILVGGLLGLFWFFINNEKWFYISLLVFVYFIPVLTAASRAHPHTGWIAILNITLGWTGIGWMVALLWCFVFDERECDG